MKTNALKHILKNSIKFSTHKRLAIIYLKTLLVWNDSFCKGSGELDVAITEQTARDIGQRWRSTAIIPGIQ